MSSLNNQLKNIKLTELLILIIILYLIQTLLNTLNIVYIDTQWIYIFVILYFAFKLKNSVKYGFDKNSFDLLEKGFLSLSTDNFCGCFKYFCFIWFSLFGRLLIGDFSFYQQWSTFE